MYEDIYEEKVEEDTFRTGYIAFDDDDNLIEESIPDWVTEDERKYLRGWMDQWKKEKDNTITITLKEIKDDDE